MNRREFLKGLLAGAALVASPTIASSLLKLPKATPAMVADGEWHNICYTFDNGVVKFYLDGVHMHPTEDLVGKYVRFERGQVVFGFEDDRYYSHPLEGCETNRTVAFNVRDAKDNNWLDNLRIWNKELTSEELRMLKL